jgi:isopenicillin-N N-acyltransferase-like protein
MRRVPAGVIMQLYTFEGSPQAAGRAHGETFRSRIHELAEIRIELTLGRTDFRDRAELLAMAQRHVEVLAQADQALHDEFMGIAAGADLGAAELVVLNHYTDLRDLSRATLYDDQGCSAVFLPGTPPVLGQTWDMHGSASPYVEAMRFDVQGAPRCLTFSLTGCLGMAGINEHGVAVTINNLNTPSQTVGVLWPGLVRIMLGCRTAIEAKARLDGLGVGSGHHYQIADATHFFGVEALAGQHHCIAQWQQGQEGELTYQGAACHTNHCLSERQAEREVLSPESTTFVRWAALEDRLAKQTCAATPEGLWDLLSDPRLSMLISEEEPHKSATCGGLVFDWRQQPYRMRTCRGPLTGQEGVNLEV